MTTAIRLDCVRKIYPRAWATPALEAVKGISLEVDEGEAFGFIGPNGAGKSTTIKILTGNIRATSGNAALFDTDVADSSARRGLGYVPENPSLLDYLSPLEILTMGVRLHRLGLADERSHCLGWLERLGLGHVANKMIRSFSKGMLQRTVLAHSLALRPRLLILDEPLSGLDPLGRKDVVDILAEFRRQGGTVFFSSHVLHDVERLADRFGLIHKGELVTIQSPNDLVGGDEIVTVRSVGETPPPGMQADAGGRWFAEVPRSDLWSLLRALESAGHTIIEIKPTLSLESAFMRYVGRAD